MLHPYGRWIRSIPENRAKRRLSAAILPTASRPLKPAATAKRYYTRRVDGGQFSMMDITRNQFFFAGLLSFFWGFSFAWSNRSS